MPDLAWLPVDPQQALLQGAIVALATVALCLFLYRRKEEDEFSRLPLPPSESGPLPWNDDFFAFMRDGPMPVFFQRLRKYNGTPFRARLFGMDTVSVYTHEHVKKVLSLEHDAVEAAWLSGTQYLLGKHSVSVSEGNTHTRLRKMLVPPFTARHLDKVLPQVVETAERHMARWAAKGNVEVVTEVKMLLHEVMVCVMMGFAEWESDGRLEASSQELEVWLDGLFVPDIGLPGTPFRKAKAARTRLLTMIEDSVRQREDVLMQRQQAAGAKVEDGVGATDTCYLIDAMLAARDEAGQALSKEAIGDICINVIFAGHDTSSSTLMHGMWLLTAHHPQVLAKLREEQDRVEADHGPGLTPEALKDMRYTAAVVNELLRFKPIVGLVPRQAQRTFELGGYRIPKGMRINVVISHSTHELCCTKSEGPFAADTFNPDRWLDPQGINPRLFMPFGGGPRMCPGYPLANMELKVMLALLARRYEWSVAPGPEVPWSNFPILRPKSGSLKLGFAQRT